MIRQGCHCNEIEFDAHLNKIENVSQNFYCSIVFYILETLVGTVKHYCIYTVMPYMINYVNICCLFKLFLLIYQLIYCGTNPILYFSSFSLFYVSGPNISRQSKNLAFVSCIYKTKEVAELSSWRREQIVHEFNGCHITHCIVFCLGQNYKK